MKRWNMLFLGELNGSRSEISTVGGEYDNLGLEMLTAIAQQAGWPVILIHQSQYGMTDEQIAALAAHHTVAGFTVLAYNYARVMQVMEKIKRENPSVTTIVGGDLPSSDPALFDNPNVDLIVIGEGETTFSEILKHLGSGKKPENIPGTVYRKKRLFGQSEFIIAESRPRITDLDTLPFAYRDPVVMKKGRICGVWTLPDGQQVCATINYSRGCKRRCIYCSSAKVWGNQVEWRSASNTCDELKQLQAMGVNCLFFIDLTFNRDPEHVISLCREMLKRNLNKMQWWAMIDPTLGESDEMWCAMRDAGCRKVGVGIEDPLFVRKLGKQDGYDTMARNIVAIDAAGIMVRAYLMVGHPQQTDQNFREMERTIQELPVGEIRISHYTPLPGTVSYAQALKNEELATADFGLFDTNHPVTKTIYDAEEIRRSIARSFYNSTAYQERKRRFINEGFDPTTYDYVERRLRQGGFMG